MLTRWSIACLPFVIITLISAGFDGLKNYLFSIIAVGLIYLVVFYFIKSGRKLVMLLVPAFAILIGWLTFAILREMKINVDSTYYITFSQSCLIIFALLKVTKRKELETNSKRRFGREEALLLISIGAVMNGVISWIMDYVNYLSFISGWSQYYEFFVYSFIQSLGVIAIIGYASCVIGIILFCLRPLVKMFFRWWFDLDQPETTSTQVN